MNGYPDTRCPPERQAELVEEAKRQFPELANCQSFEFHNYSAVQVPHHEPSYQFEIHGVPVGGMDDTSSVVIRCSTGLLGDRIERLR